jgi:hypothetical protein
LKQGISVVSGKWFEVKDTCLLPLIQEGKSGHEKSRPGFAAQAAWVAVST